MIFLVANFAFMQSMTDWPMIPTLIDLMNGMISLIGNNFSWSTETQRPNGNPAL
jgi:hypothetical protein